MPPRKSDASRTVAIAAAGIESQSQSLDASGARTSTTGGGKDALVGEKGGEKGEKGDKAGKEKDKEGGKEGKEKEKEKEKDGVNIEDLNLPKSIVARLAKGVLPPNTQIQGNAMLAMSKSATVFVNYLAGQANEFAQNSNRKTIAPDDVLKALEELEFDFRDALEKELAKFNEVQTEKRNAYRKKVAAADKAKTTSTTADAPVDAGAEGKSPPANNESSAPDMVKFLAAREGERASKKARLNGGRVAVVDGEGDETLVEEEDFVEEEEEEEEEEEDGEEEEGEEEDDEEGVFEEALEEQEEGEGEEGDEALDNGEDSD